METPDELLDAAEAARLLTCAVGTIRNWASTKRLPYVKIGRLTRFRRRDLLDWIDRHAVPALPEAGHRQVRLARARREVSAP